MGHQPDMPCSVFPEGFDSSFVIKKSGNDITVLCSMLFADNNEIAVADGCVHHGIAMDFKHKQVTVTGKPFGQPHNVINMLLSCDGCTGRNTSD